MNIQTFATRVDIIGALAFLYIIFYSIKTLKKEKNTLNWILLLIGIGGFIIDLFIVINTYQIK